MTPASRARFLASCALFGAISGGFLPLTDSDAHVSGPPPAMTGGFGEETCRACHFDYPINEAGGSLRLEGIPEKYSPGEPYLITVRLAHPQLERGGFQLASRFASGARSGQQAGSFEVLDSRTAIDDPGKAIQYLRQTPAGSSPEAKGSIQWSARWRAPRDAADPVVFHAAANAANYDDSPLGDFPYSLEATVASAREGR